MHDKSKDRSIVAKRLAEDLVGPREKRERLDARPTNVYLTGILWPSQVAVSPEDDDRLGVQGVPFEDGAGHGREPVRMGMRKPSVAGLSFCAASSGVPSVRAICRFGTYRLKKQDERDVWVRTPHKVTIPDVDLFTGDMQRIRLSEVSGDSNLPDVALGVRCVANGDVVLATLTLINECEPEAGRDSIEAASLFQTSIRVEPCDGTKLVPKPSRHLQPGESSADSMDGDSGVSDDDGAAILFRNLSEFAVGHVCSAEWAEPERGLEERSSAAWISTTWLPSAIVEGIDHDGHRVFKECCEGEGIDPFSAVDIAQAAPDALAEGLHRFCDAYGKWIDQQRRHLDDPAYVEEHLRPIGETQILRCEEALGRMRGAVDEIAANPHLRQSFQIANFAMHLQRSWSDPEGKGLRWRPFQLGFLLLSTPSAAIPDHPQREVMDLLWFPTGGGKTEAYLALVACVAVHRRLSDDSPGRDGMCALMRYTLRLLTTQQFARSAAMILALEALRTGKVALPGDLRIEGGGPFSIGLWIGSGATPNKRVDAFASLTNEQAEVPSPKQLENCPACGGKLKWSIESMTSPVKVACKNRDCDMRGDLPVATVDDDIYESPPTLLIGTSDKFAQIVREKRTHDLFGVSGGTPPDLIIQDELHLISGPLGTIAGAYETAFDLMFSSCGHRPKVVGSTATIRRARDQIRALFDRDTFQFPPSAIDHDDSGFAVRDSKPDSAGRRYFGVTTVGRSAKFTLQSVAGSLLQTAFGAFDEADRRDAYWTLVGYFNSLRDLGGALVLMQDDVADSVDEYARVRSEERRPQGPVEELTSRRTQDEIRDMLDILDRKFGTPGSVDAVLATNMVSVGVDITRLGLMVMHGQPKTISEYIQATSRVGRGSVGGIVVSILNNAEVRDRFHFETFCSWHQSLYRDVEATSVTPFAARARDRTLHAILAAAVRHLVPGMLDRPHMDDAAEARANTLIDSIVARASRIDHAEADVRKELEQWLELWRTRDPADYWNLHKGDGSLLQSAERAAARRAAGTIVGEAWPTLNSMRSVEAGTPFRMVPVLRNLDE